MPVMLAGLCSGAKGDALLEGVHDGVVDQDGAGELLAAVDDAVTDSVDLVHAR